MSCLRSGASSQMFLALAVYHGIVLAHDRFPARHLSTSFCLSHVDVWVKSGERYWRALLLTQRSSQIAVPRVTCYVFLLLRKEYCVRNATQRSARTLKVIFIPVQSLPLFYSPITEALHMTLRPVFHVRCGCVGCFDVPLAI